MAACGVFQFDTQDLLNMMSIVYFAVTFFYVAEAQTAGKCVPVGTCIAGSIIDPRIVSPSQIPCPSGQQLCSGNGEPRLPCGTNSGNVGSGYGPAAYGAYPWQAYIEDQTGYIGSGVLIDNKHVLTAAHKVQNNVFTPFYVKVCRCPFSFLWQICRYLYPIWQTMV